MKLLIVSNEAQFETKRLVEEAKALGVFVELKRPKKFSLKKFSHILFRQIQGNEKNAIVLAKKALEQGLVVVDRRLALDGSHNKKFNYSRLKKAGFFVPKTFLLSEMTKKKLDSFSSSFVVLKPLLGKRGQNVFRVRKKNFFEFAKKFAGKDFLAQEFVFIEKELRVFVVGKKVLGAIESRSKNWIHNFSRGAKAVPHRITRKTRNAALRAAAAVNTEVAGVDLAFTRKGVFVLEVNRSPGFKFFERATGKNVAGEIIKYVLGKK